MAKKKYITYKKQLSTINKELANKAILEYFSKGKYDVPSAATKYEFVKVYNEPFNDMLLSYINEEEYVTDKYIIMLIDLPTLFAKGEVMVYDGDDIHNIKFIPLKTNTEKKNLIKYIYDTYNSSTGLIVRFYTQGLSDALINYIFLLNSKK